jgi:hypothetical protein
MTMIFKLSTTALALAFLLTGGSGSEPRSGPVRSFTVALRWEAVSAPAVGRGLALNEYDDLTWARRVLIETPDGVRLVLTRTDKPRDGSAVYEIREEASGWQASLREVSGLTLSSTNEMGNQPLIVGKWLEREYPLRLRLDAPGVPGAELATTTRDEDALGRLAEQLGEQGRRAALVAGAPAGLRPALGFLQSIQAAGAAGEVELYWNIVSLLVKAFSADQVQGRTPYHGMRWELTSPDWQKGTRLTRPKELDFTRHFRSLPAHDPLATRHVGEAGGGR